MISLTVLICVHSTNDFYDDLLLRALNSLTKQTYSNFETVIVLDGCWSYTKPRIESKNYNLNLKFYEKPNREGLSYAKNYGLSKINTEWVAFLDGDDLYCPNKIESQINFIMNNNSVDFLATHSWNIKQLNEEDIFESCFPIGMYETHEEIKNAIFGECVLTHGSLMIRKKCLDELGGYNDIRGREDWDLWQRAIKYHDYKFHQIQERLYILRLGTSNIR